MPCTGAYCEDAIQLEKVNGNSNSGLVVCIHITREDEISSLTLCSPNSIFFFHYL